MLTTRPPRPLDSCYSNNVTIIDSIQSDLMYMLIITVTFALFVLSKREVKLSFYFYNIRDVFRIEGMLKVFIAWGIDAVFGTSQHIRRLQNGLESR